MLIVSGFQNMNNRNVYAMCNMSCRVSSTLFVFIVKFVGILFWTWILNLICGSGHPGIAWFLVLIPFILLFLVVFIFMANPYYLEGLPEGGMDMLTEEEKAKIAQLGADSNSVQFAAGNAA
jgi:hypothetical protein